MNRLWGSIRKDREPMFLIRSLAEEDGRTILISSHQLYQIQQVCDRVGLFVEGQLIACGRIEDLAASQMRRKAAMCWRPGQYPTTKGLKSFLEHLEMWKRSNEAETFLRNLFQFGFKP